MSTGDTDLVYDFTGIDTVVTSINTFVTKMNEHLDEVDQSFITLLTAGWKGITAQTFNDHSQAWHDSATEMARTLYDLAQKVGDAAVNMQLADQRAQGRF
jgi:WXG100 family type VII secretion target